MKILQRFSSTIFKVQRAYFRNFASKSTCIKMIGLRPRALVICGPSGSGKSTLLRRLFDEFPGTFGFSISHTTRPPRAGEEDGVQYYFVSVEDMQHGIDEGEFIEYAIFGGNMYGTSKKSVLNMLLQGKICVLDIEIEGVKQIKKTDMNALFVFVNPPSIRELERRLRERQTETEETLRKRLDQAKFEIEYGLTPGNFHLVINNTNIDDAYKELRSFILKEIKKQQKEGIQVNIKSFELEDDD